MSDNAATHSDDRTDDGIARPHAGDSTWARTQPLYIQASKERLDQPHQIVDIKNNSDVEVGNRGFAVPTKHVVVDRFNQGHEIAPGETKRGIDMLANDIQYFMRERTSGRVDHMGRLKPKHPVEIIGFDPDRMIIEGTIQPESQEAQDNRVERGTKQDKHDKEHARTTSRERARRD